MKPFARSNWERVLLVCGKCSRKLGGGFGPKGKTPLAKALRRELGVGKGRKVAVGVVETRCLKVCPKHAVTLIDAADPTRWRLVPAGASVEELARAVAAAPPSAEPAAVALARRIRIEESIVLTDT